MCESWPAVSWVGCSCLVCELRGCWWWSSCLEQLACEQLYYWPWSWRAARPQKNSHIKTQRDSTAERVNGGVSLSTTGAVGDKQHLFRQVSPLPQLQLFLWPTSGPGCDGWRPPALYWLLNAQIDVLHYSCRELIVWPHIPHLTTSLIYFRWQWFLSQWHFISAGGRVCLCSVAHQRVDKEGDVTAEQENPKIHVFEAFFRVHLRVIFFRHIN